MAFLDELRKFLGGIVGDQNTNSGLSIKKADPESHSGAFDNMIAIPFEYNAEPSEGYAGRSVRRGVLYAPQYTENDLKGGNDSLKNNKKTISIYGAELDNGDSLNYEGTLNLLNKLSKDDNLTLLTNAATARNGHKYQSENFRENLRKFLNGSNPRGFDYRVAYPGSKYPDPVHAQGQTGPIYSRIGEMSIPHTTSEDTKPGKTTVSVYSRPTYKNKYGIWTSGYPLDSVTSEEWNSDKLGW